MEEKRDYDKELEKKDSLMWTDEDYQTIEKITGFDEESIEADRKKGIQIVIFVVVCLLMLVIGFVLGYTLPKEERNARLLIDKEEVNPIIKMAYTRKNSSGELYLYLLDNNDMEHMILNLSDYSFYKYQFYDGSLYVILTDEKMSLYKINLSANGYTNNKEKEFINEYDNIHFVNNKIYFLKEQNISVYDIKRDDSFDISINIKIDNILDINEKYLIFVSENKTNILNLENQEIEIIGENILQTIFMGNNILYYKENINRETVLFYEYSLFDKSSDFIAEVSFENSILMNIKDTYLYTDKNNLYSYDGIANNEIYATENGIGEIAYLNADEVIVIPSTYDNLSCSDKITEVAIINITTKKVSIKKLSGCLDTKIINDVLFAE